MAAASGALPVNGTLNPIAVNPIQTNPLPGMNTGAANPLASNNPTVPVAGPQSPVAIPATGSPVAPTSGTVPVGGTSISSGLSTVDGSHTLVGDFKDTYGSGTGTALANTLAGLGTATDGAVSATNAQIMDTTNKQRANIASGLAASGISADSSTSALAQGDFDSSVAATIAATDSGMELSEENTLISALQQEGTAHGSDTSAWDTFSSIMGGGLLGSIGSAANAANETSASGTGGLSSILSTIGMFA